MSGLCHPCRNRLASDMLPERSAAKRNTDRHLPALAEAAHYAVVKDKHRTGDHNHLNSCESGPLDEALHL